MILHNVMWESRPLPKIVRDPLAALSARGSFFVPAPPGIFCFGDGRQTLGDLKEEKLAGRETFLGKKVLPPRTPPFQKLLPVGLRGCRRLCSVQQGESPSVCLRQHAMLVFIIASANHAPQPVNEPASNEASGSRHVFRWTDADPGSFPGYARLKKAVVTAVTAASVRLTRDSRKSRHGCALGSWPFAP